MKKICLFLTFLLIILANSNIKAQSDGFEFDSRHYLGGNIGLQFGTVIHLNFSPHYGFYFTERFSSGIGLSYQYYNSAMYSPPLTLHIAGGNVFSRFDILDVLYLHVENEMLTYETDMFSPIRTVEQIYSYNLFGGAGYRILFGHNSKDCTYIMLLYNFNETKYTPYTNPVIRFGIELHF
jgi:hypothetical protein